MFEALFGILVPKEKSGQNISPQKNINFPHRLRTSIRNLCCQHLYHSFYRSYHHILSKCIYKCQQQNHTQNHTPLKYHIHPIPSTTLNPMQTPPNRLPQETTSVGGGRISVTLASHVSTGKGSPH